MKLHPGPKCHIFHILLASKDIDDVIFCLWKELVCLYNENKIMKRKLLGGLKIWRLFSRFKNNILLTDNWNSRPLLWYDWHKLREIESPGFEPCFLPCSIIKELSTKSSIIHTSEIKTGEILTYNHVWALTELKLY